jgi:hypothetical protein
MANRLSREATALVLATVTWATGCGGSSTNAAAGGPAAAASPAPATSGPGAPAAPNPGTAAPPAAASPTAEGTAASPSAAADLAAPTATQATPAPAIQSVSAAPGTMSVTTKAIELRVDGVTTAKELGGRQARVGYEFVIVDTSWKNVIPLVAVDKTANTSPTGGLSGFGTGKRPPPDPKNITMESTPFVIPALKRFMWLMSDERYADSVDVDALEAVPDHLPGGGFTVAKLNDVVRGKLVFEAPADAKYRAFQFYDVEHGHALIPLAGSKPAPPATIGPMQQNDVLQLGVSEAGFGPAGRQAPAGLRYYTVGLRGISRSPKDIIDLPIGLTVYAQNDRGCVSPPALDVSELRRPFGEMGSFPPTSQNEGQVAFLVPADTKSVRVLVTPAKGGGMVLPAGPAFTPSWPAPQTTIQDGSTLKVHVLPLVARPASVPAPAAGREIVVLDIAIENLKPNQGIEFQGDQQLRLMNPAGGFIQPAPISNQLSCRLGDNNIIPAGNARRFQLVYDIPANMPLKLQYRGFEKDEAVVDIKR